MDGRASVWYAVSWNRDSHKLDKINSGGEAVRQIDGSHVQKERPV